MDELLFMLSLSNNHNPFSVVRFIGHAFSPEASNKYYKFLFVRDFYTFEGTFYFFFTVFVPSVKRRLNCVRIVQHEMSHSHGGSLVGTSRS